MGLSMKVSNNVFGSNSERANYQKLLNQWGDKYNVYQNLPFMMVMDISRNEVSTSVFNYLLKTSIDYVVCDEHDKPLIGIEFDGMQQGVNIGNEYLPKKDFDKSRKWKIETKLTISQKCNFPLVVVGDNEFNFLSNTGLTIIDGIIGMFATQQYLELEFNDERFEKYLLEHEGMTIQDYDELNSEDKFHIYMYFGTDVEVDADWQNPIIRKRWQIYNNLSKLTWVKSDNARKQQLLWSQGGIPIADHDKYATGRFTWKHTQYGEIEKIVILPRFVSSNHKFYLDAIATEIAALIGIIEMAERMGVEIDDN